MQNLDVTDSAGVPTVVARDGPGVAFSKGGGGSPDEEVRPAVRRDIARRLGRALQRDEVAMSGRGEAMGGMFGTLRRALLAGVLLTAPAWSQTANGPGRGSDSPAYGVLRGVVYDDSTRAGVVAVSITLVDETGEMASKISQSDTAGYFEVMVPAAGRYRLVARREGYTAIMSSMIDMASGESMEMELPLSTNGVAQSQGMIVNREPMALMSWVPAPFERRRSAGVGQLVGPEWLRRRRSRPVGELLATLGWSGAAGAGSQGCRLSYLLNGERSTAADDDLLRLSTAELRAMEYHRAGEVPKELAAAAVRGCPVVVLWTR